MPAGEAANPIDSLRLWRHPLPPRSGQTALWGASEHPDRPIRFPGPGCPWEGPAGGEPGRRVAGKNVQGSPVGITLMTAPRQRDPSGARGSCPTRSNPACAGGKRFHVRGGHLLGVRLRNEHGLLVLDCQNDSKTRLATHHVVCSIGSDRTWGGCGTPDPTRTAAGRGHGGGECRVSTWELALREGAGHPAGRGPLGPPMARRVAKSFSGSGVTPGG